MFVNMFYTEVIDKKRIKIPKQLFKEFKLKDGQSIFLEKKGNTIVISCMQDKLAQVRQKMAAYHSGGVSLVDGLIESRRLEAAHE